MKTDNNKLHPIDTATLMDEWVLESCFLDLLADEENPDDIDDWVSPLEWTSALVSARDRVRKIRRNNEGVWWPSADWPDLPQFNDSLKVAEWFCNMKASRIRASLECNQKRLHYASSPGEKERQSVCDEERAFRRTLDAIILDSLAAFASIQRQAMLQEQELVLSALIHSEVCASGTTADVSYGMARAFDTFFLNTEWRWRKLCRLISMHNQARGWNHQGNYLECIRQLVPLLENFEVNVQGEDPKYLPLAMRLVYFPAVFTLSDALRDCHRTTEAAWWIRSALKSQPSNYWKSRLNTELSSFVEDGSLPEKSTKPKLLNQEQQVEYLKIERQISERVEINDFSDCTSKWADALSWTIRWHEGDPFNLLGSIQGAAQSIHVISEALKKHLANNKKKQTFNYCFDNINKVMERLREAILRNAKANANPDLGLRLRPVFQFLSPENDLTASDLKQRQRINIWKALSWLLPALEATIDFRKELIEPMRLNEDAVGSELVDWQKKLKDRLKEAWQQKRFAGIAADQKVLEILKNESNLCTSELHRKEGCSHKPNCVTTTLTLGDNVLKSDSDVASTDYLLTRMARTDAEFIRFLENPSLEHARYSKDPVTPWTEFISLRRWNSFSPNLASRGTTTVGGGYLVRVWNEDCNEYLGIAIDPGYNYLENLFDEGFTLPDLNVIVVTHAHPDHVENLSNVLTLLRERKSRLKKDKIRKVFLVLTEGVFQRFKTLFDNEIEFIEDIVVLSWASRVDHGQPDHDTVYVVPSPQKNGSLISLRMGTTTASLVSIQAVPAIHADGTEYDSMGVVLRVAGRGDHRDLCVGFTGDTRYDKNLCVNGGFSDCDVLVPHLGSVIKNNVFRELHEKWRRCDHEERLNKVVAELQPTLTEKNHLYLPGITMLLCDLRNNQKDKPPLILLSEFGEELRGGLRADLATRLSRVFGMTVLPADVGLRVGVEDRSVRCVVCRRYVREDKVSPVPVSDEDEALMFVCHDCYHARKHELPMLLSRLRNTPHEHFPAYSDREPLHPSA